MDGPTDYHTKWSLSQKETNTIWYHLYVDSKIGYNWIYLQNRNRFIDLEDQRERQWGRDKLGVWDYIKYISNKVQLYRTGSYIHYSIIKHNGKEYEICTTELFCCTSEINI